MRKNVFRLKSRSDVPLLEQEKIKDFVIINKYPKVKLKRELIKATVTIFSTFLFIGIILFVFFVNKGNEIYTQLDSTDKQESYHGSDTEMTSKVTDVEAIIPVETENSEDETFSLSLDELYEFDYSKIAENEVGIIPMDLSQSQNGVLYINNSTGLIPDLKSLIEKNFKGNSFDLLANNDGPKVLVLHTHATDSYVYCGQDSYRFDSNREFARSDESDKNMISIGNIISQILNENGISTIHCTTLHDSIRYKDSYLRSEATVKEYLERYPSIKLVIDVHRDSLITSGGDIVRPVTLAENMPTAQVVCTVGSNWVEEGYDTWQDNLSLALKLRERLNIKYSNLCRPVELSEYTYNQELSRYAMTIKIGSCGNSLDEAKLSAKIVAQNLAEILKTIPF